MIKFCVEKWDKNKSILEKHIREKGNTMNEVCYLDLVKMVVDDIFNDGEHCHHDTYCYDKYDSDRITEIDNGEYQGTLLFMIPATTYQPGASDYLMTYVYYGSCSVCDTLQSIKNWDDKAALTEEQVTDFMQLCLNIVQNTIKPYNTGWHHEEDYDIVENCDEE